MSSSNSRDHLRTLIQQLDDQEDVLRTQLRDLIGQVIAKSDDIAFKYMLKQRGFFGVWGFIPLYDMAINGVVVVSDHYKKYVSVIEVLRWLQREEYPENKPSHREDLCLDRLALGMAPNDILDVTANPQTQKVFQKLCADFLIVHGESDDFQVIKCLQLLRSFYEVQTGEEYFAYKDRLETYGLTNTTSKFYLPHYYHDYKRTSLVDIFDDISHHTHSDEMSTKLIGLLASEQHVAYCAEITQKSYDLKMEFYRQFL